MGFRDYLKKREQERYIRKTLSKFIPPEEVSQLLERSSAGEDLDAPRQMPLHYIFVRFHTENLSDIPKRVSDLLSVVDPYSARIIDMLSSIIVVAPNPDGPPEATTPERTLEIVNGLQAAFGRSISIVFGYELCLIGNVAGPNSMRFGVLYPRLPQILHRLLALGPGETANVTP